MSFTSPVCGHDVPLSSLLQLDQQYNEFKLRSIMSEHKKTITAISWCPDNPDLFASASADNLLIVWNVAEKKAVARLDNTKGRWTMLSQRTAKGRYYFFSSVSSLYEVSQPLVIPLRRPRVRQLVLELSRRSGVHLPARSPLHLGLSGVRPRSHSAQRSPLLPV